MAGRSAADCTGHLTCSSRVISAAVKSHLHHHQCLIALKKTPLWLSFMCWGALLQIRSMHVHPAVAKCTPCGLACSGPSALDHVAAQLTVSMMSLADTGVSEAAAAVGDKAADAVVSGATAVQSATDAAAAAVQRDNGWFGFFTGPFESILKVCHLVPLQTLHTQLLCGRGMGSRSNCWYSASCNGRSRGVSLSGARCVCVQVLDSGLDKLHVPYSYGFAIILLTVLVKALTFPLSRKQVPCPALVASSLAAPSLLPQA